MTGHPRPGGHSRQPSDLPPPRRGDSRASLKAISKSHTSSFGGTGRVGSLTPHQAGVLAQFRRELEAQGVLAVDDSLGTDDATLLRFLRARNFVLAKSLEMIKACVHWRRTVCDVGMDRLYEEVIDPFDYAEREAVFEHWPLYFHGVSKQGLPINIQHFGKIDLRKVYQNVDQKRHWEAVIANCECLPRECMPACSEAAGRQVEGAFCIVDLKGFSISQFWGFRTMAQKLFQISQDYYPETMGRVVVCNCPFGFSSVWKVIKPWLAPVTVAKFSLQGSNYKDELLQYIDADQLPKSLGGTCDCQPKGCMLTNKGPWQEARKRYGIEVARKGRNRAHVDNPAAANDEAARQAAEEAAAPTANGSSAPPHDGADRDHADVLQSEDTAHVGHPDSDKHPATAHPPHSVATSRPHPTGDPRLTLAPGQGPTMKRMTSHGVERVMAPEATAAAA